MIGPAAPPIIVYQCSDPRALSTRCLAPDCSAGNVSAFAAVKVKRVRSLLLLRSWNAKKSWISRKTYEKGAWDACSAQCESKTENKDSIKATK